MDDDKVSQLSKITGLSKEEAVECLKRHNGNVEIALDAFFDQGTSLTAEEEEFVREPIPKKQEVLVPQSLRGRRGRPTITDVPFRNFALEGQLQAQMMEEGISHPPKKVSRLEALFVPPIDIMFPGSFDMAREFAKRGDMWLMVNLQNNLNFACQVLNRDLWSNDDLKDFIKDNVVFWQQSSNSIDGGKFKSFYKVMREPYIGIIDPRTGEEVTVMNCDLEAKEFRRSLRSFLQERKSPEGQEVLESVLFKPSSAKIPATNSKLASSTSTSTSTKSKAPATATSTASSYLEEFLSPVKLSSDESSSEDDDSIPYPEKTKLMLKMPENTKQVMYCDKISTLATIISKIKRKNPVFKSENLRLFCQAINKDLTTLDGTKNLLELQIHPSAVIHITLED